MTAARTVGCDSFGSERKETAHGALRLRLVIIGSGFGGSVAALRAAEKGYHLGVMESGRRWKDEEIPKTQWDLPHFLWQPEAEMYGILDEGIGPRYQPARLAQRY
jgi:choline dehydrogenase-like flavoprotein